MNPSISSPRAAAKGRRSTRDLRKEASSADEHRLTYVSKVR
jgi:hypothetical protein